MSTTYDTYDKAELLHYLMVSAKRQLDGLQFQDSDHARRLQAAMNFARDLAAELRAEQERAA